MKFKYNRDDKEIIISISNIEGCLKNAVNDSCLCEYEQNERLFIEQVLQDVVPPNIINEIIKPNTRGNRSTIYYRIVSYGNRDSKNPSRYAHTNLGHEIETLAKTQSLINFLSSSVRKNVVIPIEKMITEEYGMDNELIDFYEKAVILLQDMVSEENTFYDEVKLKLKEIIDEIKGTEKDDTKRNGLSNLISWLVAVSLLQDKANQLFPKSDDISDKPFISIAETRIERMPSLKSTPYESSIKVIGRDDEMEELHRYLTNERVVFISAVGGCGKTQLALRYISEKRNEYRTIVMAKYETSLTDLLNSDVYFSIDGFTRKNEESDIEYAERKLKKIAQLSNENDLIVIDNFDTLSDDLLDAVLHLPCRILFTTRTNFEHMPYPQLILDTLKPHEQRQLFEQNFKRKIQNTDYEILDKILECISGHTLTIVLFARMMDKQRIKFKDMLETLQTEGISPSMRGIVHIGTEENRNVYNHILKLMRIGKLTDEETAVMRRLSLLPLSGVPFDSFIDWCHIENCDIINGLIDRNWVIHDTEKDYLLLHPIISDIVRNEMTDPFKQCEDMLTSLSLKFARNWDEMLADERMEYVEYAKSLYHKLPHKIKENFLLFRHIGIIFKNCSYLDIYQKLLYIIREVLGTEDSVELAWTIFDIGDFECYMYQLDEANDDLIKAAEMIQRIIPNSYDYAYMTKSIAWNQREIYRTRGELTSLDLSKKYLTESDFAFNESIKNEETRYGSYVMSERYDHATTNQVQKASLIYNWAETVYFYGEYDKAIKLAEDSFNLYKLIYGENEIKRYSPIKTMAKAYSKKGDFNKASELIKEAIYFRSISIGCKSKYYWRYVEHYADICYENGELKESLNQFYEIKKQMQGMEDSHPRYYDYINKKIDRISAEIKG